MAISNKDSFTFGKQRSYCLALDAMGGDKGPAAVVEGASMALERYPALRFMLFGEEQQLNPLLDQYPPLKEKTTVVHTDEWIKGDDKPVVALRQLKKSSMRLALEALEKGEADALISSGNTGSLLALSTVLLKRIPGVKRPAICTYFPNRRSQTVMLDLGANLETSAEVLVQFAVLGSVFAQGVSHVEKPTIGLLNVGSEPVKGNAVVQEAASLLQESSLSEQYYGFVEGNDIAEGTVDVIVTDGFSGNVALKTLEGSVRLVAEFMQTAFKSSFLSKVGYLFASHSIRKLRQRLDPRRYNGAVFLGLNRLVVKSHGGADGIGFATALDVAVDMLEQDSIAKISKQIHEVGHLKPKEDKENL